MSKPGRISESAPACLARNRVKTSLLIPQRRDPNSEGTSTLEDRDAASSDLATPHTSNRSCVQSLRNGKPATVVAPVVSRNTGDADAAIMPLVKQADGRFRGDRTGVKAQATVREPSVVFRKAFPGRDLSKGVVTLVGTDARRAGLEVPLDELLKKTKAVLLRDRRSHQRTNYLDVGFQPDDGSISTLLFAASKRDQVYCSGETPAAMAFEFINRHRGLFRIPSSPRGVDGIKSCLRVTSESVSRSPSGDELFVARLQQRVGELDVWDSDCVFLFIENRLQVFTGRLRGSLFGMHPAYHSIGRARAEAVVRQMPETKAGLHIVSCEPGFESGLKRPIWVVSGLVRTSREYPGGGVRVIIDGLSGEVHDVQWTDGHQPVDGTFTHFTPSRESSTAADVSVRAAPAWQFSTGEIVPWQIDAPDMSDLYVYSGSVVLGQRRNGVNAIGTYGGVAGNFNAPPASTPFNVQHAYYWARQAWRVGDLNYRFFPPPQRNRYKPLAVLVNQSCDNAREACDSSGMDPDAPCGTKKCYFDRCQGGTASATWEGCPPGVTAFSRHGSDSICIQLCSNRRQLSYRDEFMVQARVTEVDRNLIDRTVVGPINLGTMFHEVGHAVSMKYTDGTRTQVQDGNCDERTAFDETLPDMFVDVASIGIFRPQQNFTWLDPDTGRGMRLTPPHQGPGTRFCHGLVPSGNRFNPVVPIQLALPCNARNRRYGIAMRQAFWEFTNAQDCTTLPCTPMELQGTDHARWAYFFASMLTSKSVRLPFQTFAGLLSLFYALPGWGGGFFRYLNRVEMFSKYNLAEPFFVSVRDCDGVRRAPNGDLLISANAPPDSRLLL
jgi:hypothetical protein